MGWQPTLGSPAIRPDEVSWGRASPRRRNRIKLGVGVAMTEDSNLNGSWKPTARSDADVDLLQRSINHVEHLLDRLEMGAVSTSQGEGSDKSEMRTASGADTIARAQPGGSRTVAAPLPLAAQTDALRITLEAHEEASRIRAQAAAMHAEVIAQRERLFIATRQLFETLRVDAIYESAPGAGMPRAVGQVQTEPTDRDARNRVDANVAEIALPADAVKLLVHDFPGLVAGLSDALACLQKLTTAFGAEIPPTAASVEPGRLRDAPGDPDDQDVGYRLSTNALDVFVADVSTTDHTAGHGRAPTANRAKESSFRIARR